MQDRKKNEIDDEYWKCKTCILYQDTVMGKTQQKITNGPRIKEKLFNIHRSIDQHTKSCEKVVGAGGVGQVKDQVEALARDVEEKGNVGR